MPDAIRALIVDDEPLARANLRHALASHAQVQVAAECATVREARASVADTAIDVVFLDIRMPVESGLVLARELVTHPEPPLVVFVTAHGDFAIEAFDIHALDYLLKPVDDARLAQCVTRITELLHLRQRATYADAVRDYLADPGASPAEAPPRYLTRLSVRSIGRIESVLVDDVQWIHAAGNYVELHMARRRLLHRVSLGALERRLDPSVFLRVHRSTLVRRSEVRGLRVTGDGTYQLRLQSGAVVAVSERYVGAVRAALGE